MFRKRGWLLLPVTCVALLLIGCGDEVTNVVEQPAIESEFTYVGNSGEGCMHCHANTVETWSKTGHQAAYADLSDDSKTNLYCLQCHTTGFDSPVNFGDTEITNPGPDPYGYDDYALGDTEDAAMRRTALEGVQCESCHGPMGPTFNTHRPDLNFATRAENGESLSLCSPCHSTQLDEWATSGHGTVQGGSIEAFNDEHYAHVGSCQACHTSEGFVRANDPAFADYEFGEQVSFIGCVTCHDPHQGETDGGNIHQLRNLSPVEVAYAPGTAPGEPSVPRMEGYGTGQLCAQCHHARRSTSNVEGQIADGYAHFGPHGSPQMDMFIGAGCFEIPGFTYDGSHVHQTAVTDACVKCHMVRETFLHGEITEHAFHTFQPDPGNCVDCHGTLPDFDYNGVQTEITGQMDTLAQALGYTDLADFLANWDSQDPSVLVWQREAAYALVFVNNDGSLGVHNPKYTRDLLQNAIDHVNAQVPLASN
jgi:hypothetical protein